MLLRRLEHNAPEKTRTSTPFTEPELKSGAPTNYATGAQYNSRGWIRTTDLQIMSLVR